jgi:hypothetical protein
VARLLTLAICFRSGFTISAEGPPLDLKWLNFVYEMGDIAARGGDIRQRLFGPLSTPERWVVPISGQNLSRSLVRARRKDHRRVHPRSPPESGLIAARVRLVAAACAGSAGVSTSSSSGISAAALSAPGEGD